ncbi:hypothetical protein [Streptomyces noursei]|uniref:hypothetical protein n=1 Tax=Streptomyces noursei TaxID=1971 RepID=UPI0016721C16|nr:hypothetical protein [Streptomyces noursei]MCZ1021322.1 hypothetical protein [Streptomyces noursei]GGX55833.1 hypothetical protein GCM10010341_90710 [Streptomyces noursei]
MDSIMTRPPRPPDLPADPTDHQTRLSALFRRQVQEGDQKASKAGRRVPRSSHEQRAHIASLLTVLADHLGSERPDEPMTEAARMTVALNVAGTKRTVQPLLRLLPWPTHRQTRREYADQLRELATSAAAQHR